MVYNQLKGYTIISQVPTRRIGTSYIWRHLKTKGIDKEFEESRLILQTYEAPHEKLGLFKDLNDSILLSKQPDQVNIKDNFIWLSRECFAGFATRFIEIEYENHSFFWEWRNLGGDKDVDLFGSFPTKGVLYAFMGEDAARPGNNLAKFRLREFEECFFVNEGEELPENAIAYLNPLVMKFDIDQNWPSNLSELSKEFTLTYREPDHLIDLHPRYENLPTLRYCLYDELSRHWKKKVYSPMSCLMFDTEWTPDYLPFALLDEMGGTFFINRFASTGRTEYVWGHDELNIFSKHALWLVDWCIEKMGIRLDDRINEASFESINRSGFASQIVWGEPVSPPSKPVYEQLAELSAQENENKNNLLNLLLSWWERLSKDDQMYIGKLINRCYEADGFNLSKAIAQLGQETLLPRANFFVFLPEVPKCKTYELTNEYWEIWKEFRDNKVLDLKETPLYPEEWWLKELFVDSSVCGQSSELWTVNEHTWHYPFYQYLFNAPQDFMPKWRICAGGHLGEARLGTLILGEKARVSTFNLDSFELR